MPAERRPETTDAPGSNGARRRPRVVMFQLPGRASVEVLDLPEGAGVGSSIRHRGRLWRISGARTGNRVLIAEPESN